MRMFEISANPFQGAENRISQDAEKVKRERVDLAVQKANEKAAQAQKRRAKLTQTSAASN